MRAVSSLSPTIVLFLDRVESHTHAGWLSMAAKEYHRNGLPSPPALTAVIGELEEFSRSSVRVPNVAPSCSDAGSWITTTAVASRLGVTERWVRKLCVTGRVVAKRNGKHWLIDETRLNERCAH